MTWTNWTENYNRPRFLSRGNPITCDLCGEAKDCLPKEIDGKEYDICSDSWNPLAQKPKGKGRAINRETGFLPPPSVVKEREDDAPEPLPGEPKIYGAA